MTCDLLLLLLLPVDGGLDLAKVGFWMDGRKSGGTDSFFLSCSYVKHFRYILAFGMYNLMM